MPLAVPLGFWSGDTKLAWPVDDLERMFAVFPTLHLSFAVDNDSSQAFTLGVTPQVCVSVCECVCVCVCVCV